MLGVDIKTARFDDSATVFVVKNKEIQVNYRALAAVVFCFLFVSIGVILYLLNFSPEAGGNFIFNASPSHVPVGIYRRVESLTGIDRKGFLNAEYLPVVSVKKGDIVDFNLDELYALYPERKDDDFLLLSRDRHFLKIIGAIEGDMVNINNNNCVVVNGKTLNIAKIFPKYKNGKSRVKIKYPYTVPKDCVFLITNSVDSYDSRYFGAVPIKLLGYKFKPVFTYTGEYRFW